MSDTNINEFEGKMETQESRHSRWTYSSFGMYQITWTVIYASMNLFLFYYYHAVIGLEAWLIFLAMAIFAVYDAINEPIIGYLVDRNFKWTRKLGRRFPWIVVSGIPWCLSLYLIFSVPDIDARVNPWPVFWWLIMSLFIFDFFITLLDVNVGALRADKFRTETERRRYSRYFGPIDMVAQVIGMTIPPLFLGLGEGKASFAIMGALVAFIAIISTILFLPGAREDKIVIDRYFSREYERIGFFKGIKEVITQKSFITFWLSYTAFSVATTIMTATVVYLTIFVLLEDAEIMMPIIFAILLTGALISVLFWSKLVKKTNNNKKIYTIGSFILCAAMIPLTFFVSIIDLCILTFILGFAMGSVWTLGVPVLLSNVQDDYVVRTGKNQKGILLGTWAFIGRFTGFIDELLLALVFGITGFVAGYETYSELKKVVTPQQLINIQWGIRLLMGVIPMLVMLIGTLIFWKFYPLTQAKVLENKAKLKELGF